MSWLWVRALPSVRQRGASDAPARACSQFSEYEFRDLPTGARGQVPLSWHPIIADFSLPRLILPRISSPRVRLRYELSCLSRSEVKGHDGFVRHRLFQQLPPQNARCPWHGPHHDRNSRYRRRPLLQDLPKYPQTRQWGPKDRNAPLYLCTTPPLPPNQHPALTSQRSRSSSEAKGQMGGCRTSHHLCISQGKSQRSGKGKGWPQSLFLIRQNSCLRGNRFMDHLGLVLKPWQRSVIDQLS